MDNLLERASIVLTPTAYNDAELLCVKPSDGSGDFDFSRNSSATRVNAQGLVEDVQILSGNLVTNGDFSNGSTDWILNDWTVADGKASLLNGSSFINQNNILEVGKTYKIQYTISDYVSGNIRWRAAGVNGSVNTSNGVVTDYITVASTSFGIQGYNGFTGSITNISVIEITDDTNLPRINYEGFSYDGSGNIIPNSGCGHLLFEPQSTNLITHSEDFSQWSKINGGTASAPSVTTNYGISPDGTQNASRVIFDLNGGTTSSDYSQIQSFVTVTIGDDYTTSVYMKSNDSNSYSVTFSDVNGGANVMSVTPQWQRFDVPASAITTSGSIRIRTKVSEGSSNVTDVLIWGAMLEEQDYATSYIPTEGTTKTRNQDLCTGGGSVSTISSTEGVLYAEISALEDGVNGRYISIGDGSFSNYIYIRITGVLNQVKMGVIKGGSTQASKDFVVPNLTQFNKLALSYSQDLFKFYVNGTLIFTDTSGDTFPVGSLNTLTFNISNSPNNFLGKTKCLAVWKEALSDTELTELTTI